MKLSKDQINSAIWILVILIILFTPIGFHLKVFVGKLFAGNADVVELSEQKTLKNYNWNLVDLKGNELNFESQKDKVVFVNFWATWCPPCIAELPSLVKLHNDYGDKVAFYFVANDEKTKVTTLLEKKNYQLPVYFEISETPTQLQSKSIPATYIINKSGNIVVAEKGAANWNSESTRNLLDKLLLE
ncbi:TlpA family protein disulfide reductase [Flagellimonas hymeniacidonis]|uniref:TlpA family protein disulfide reductase n=1 Tax=Flagellimonas hymeniacidonis TaxID=2603628 RepID=A0A5C8V1J3_9FLAO|nr:TlpA disulfide reductase family protein [Flagellimonas hymeniacidonis]TXN34299.1 TlpA family protein disulfide reductase [Flagellimonas hymeniacidonis]